jgi:NDP-sugar pyrophosphorylase family protein
MPMHILIPAGGRGVRLRPLTSLCPKPLLPLGDRPILTRIIENLPRDLPKTILVPPSLEAPFQRWRDSLPERRNVRLYVEPVAGDAPRGPVAAIAACLAEMAIDDDLLMLMGDSLLPFTVRQFLGRGLNNAPRLAAYPLADIREAGRFGVVEIDRHGYVTSFEEKPERPRSPWVFTGCLYLPQRLLPALRGMLTDLPPQMGEIVADTLRHGERVEVFPVTGEWHDIGTFESYLQAHRALLPEARRQSLLSQGNLLNGSVYVHPSASVTNSRLTDCIVLAGARLVETELTSCIVQPHVAMTQRAAQRKVITTECELPVGGGLG